jgi:predicted N-formylglutamate amidohydrolase
MTELLLSTLRADSSLIVGDNQPYPIRDDSDYGIPVHGDGRGLPSVLVEIRQDLIADERGASAWAMRLAHCLRAIAHLETSVDQGFLS